MKLSFGFLFLTLGLAFAAAAEEVELREPALPERSAADEQIAAFVSRNAAVLSNLGDNTTLAISATGSLSILPVPLACTHGPRRVIHTQGRVLFWPRIIKRSCDGLRCDDPKCLPRSQVYRTTTRFVYRILNTVPPRALFLGYRRVRYADHTSCKCRQCSYFRVFKECHCQKRCPNIPFSPIYQDSFCLWKETRLVALPLESSSNASVIPVPSRRLQYAKGSCTCCRVPRSCRNPLHVFSRIDCRCQCPYQQSCPCNKTFNQNTCACECPAIRCPPHYKQDPVTCQCVCKRSCPSPSYLNKTTCECVGNCSRFTGSNYCERTRCEEYEREFCRHISGSCQCPTQEPRSCSDITNPKNCVNTICPNKPELRCRYQSGSGCHCPCCHPRTNSPVNNYNCNSLNTWELRCRFAYQGQACNWVC